MPQRDTTLIQELWTQQPLVDKGAVFHWIDLMHEVDESYWQQFAYQAWLDSERSDPCPDLLLWIAHYAGLRLRSHNWKLPIRLGHGELNMWQEGGYFMDRDKFHEEAAGIAGGFLSVTGREPLLFGHLLLEQLAKSVSDLKKLAALPLDTNYTPRAATASVSDSSDYNTALHSALVSAIGDEKRTRDIERFERPFTLRQQLECFSYGLEKLRMLAVTETDEELRLPNQDLADALMTIDLNQLAAQLQTIDVDLRRIWQNLARYNYYGLNDAYEPKRFWWRHWESRKRSSPIRR